MFITFLKSSWKALPFLVLFPVLSYIVFALLVNDHFNTGRLYVGNEAWLPAINSDEVDWGFLGEGLDEDLGWDLDGGLNERRNDEGNTWMMYTMIAAIAVNFILLMILPAAIGGIDPRSKKALFYLGFFINLILMLLIPIFAYTKYLFDPLSLCIMIALYAVSFLLPFILGARRVAPAYVRAFWFYYR